ncbi:hypothetical protein B5M09_010159 [Aphanomyces astaci]|uniref:Uncharacterized protein n=1 Tax=Aphanomyces astaci TaxID=112090 RepID=A0A3R7WGN4_APHAT|nr:hypothetical protein B5M09_010159 [Aphanomyces astaci]
MASLPGVPRHNSHPSTSSQNAASNDDTTSQVLKDVRGFYQVTNEDDLLQCMEGLNALFNRAVEFESPIKQLKQSQPSSPAARRPKTAAAAGALTPRSAKQKEYEDQAIEILNGPPRQLEDLLQHYDKTRKHNLALLLQVAAEERPQVDDPNTETDHCKYSKELAHEHKLLQEMIKGRLKYEKILEKEAAKLARKRAQYLVLDHGVPLRRPGESDAVHEQALRDKKVAMLRHQLLQKETKRLVSQEREANVAHMKNVQAFQKQLAARKIQANYRRIDNLKEVKQAIVDERNRIHKLAGIRYSHCKDLSDEIRLTPGPGEYNPPPLTKRATGGMWSPLPKGPTNQLHATPAPCDYSPSTFPRDMAASTVEFKRALHTMTTSYLLASKCKTDIMIDADINALEQSPVEAQDE